MTGLHLVQNETLKIYKRKIFWIMLAILAALILLLAFLDFKSANTHDHWQKDLKADQTVDMGGAGDAMEKSFINQMKDEQLANDYHIKHNIPPLFDDTVLGFVNFSNDVAAAIISVFIVIIAGSIVSQEYSWGTIKLLLIRPVDRWKILLSKFIASIIIGVVFLIASFILSLLFGMLFFGFDFGESHYIYARGGVVHDVSVFYHFLQTYGSHIVDIIMISSFAFMLSTIFKSNALAIGLSVFISYAGSMAVSILSMFNDKIPKYLFFLNTNLYQYVEGPSLLPDTSLGFSVTVLVIYFIIFMAISFVVFQKRDVTA